MAAVLLAALLGLFGDGWLSRVRAGSAGALGVEYDRLLRSNAPAEYRVRVNRAFADAGQLRLRVSSALMEHVELESIQPRPDHEIVGSGYVEFVFRVAPGSEPMAIDVRFRPTTFGRYSGQVSIAGAQPVSIDQFVYP